MKIAVKRFAQLYLFVFFMISGLVFVADIESRRVDDVLPKALAHGAIWPVTVLDWLDGAYW